MTFDIFVHEHRHRTTLNVFRFMLNYKRKCDQIIRYRIQELDQKNDIKLLTYIVFSVLICIFELREAKHRCI